MIIKSGNNIVLWLDLFILKKEIKVVYLFISIIYYDELRRRCEVVMKTKRTIKEKLLSVIMATTLILLGGGSK